MSFSSKIKKIDWARIAQICLPYITIVAVTYLMINYQIDNQATFITGDRFLHFYRFYDTSMQIKTGNFSYFQTNYGFNQSGRIFNALYGPLFAYINGFVLLLCGTWFKYQILVDFVVFLIGGIGMYHLGLKAKVNNLIALLLAVFYLQFGIILGILRANNFMAWGAALAPYVLMHAIYMVEDKKRPIHWLSLGILMALVGQIHILTTVILAFTLVPFAIYGLVVTPNKKQMIIDFFKAVCVAIILTANVWGAFLVVYPGNKIASPNTFHLGANAVHLSKSLYYSHQAFSGIFIALIIAQAIYVIFKYKKSPLNTMVTAVAIFALIVSSKLMPWAKIQGRLPKLGNFLQFPYRLAVGAIPLILLGIGISLTQIMNNSVRITKEYIVIILMLAIMQCFAGAVRTIFGYTNAFLDPNHVITMSNRYKVPKDRSEIKWITRYTNDGRLFEDISRSEPDYLPVNPAANNVLYRHTILDKQKKYKRQIIGDKMILTWTSKKNEKRRLPIVLYKRSKLVVNGKDVTNIAPRNTINNPLVNAKKGKNVAELSYQAPNWFWGLLVITILGWIGALAFGIYNWFKKRDNKD